MRVVPAIALAALSGAAVAQDPSAARARGDHIDVSLLAEQDALVPGRSAQFGIRLQHDPHWHTYWINPGDSGLPTRLAWTLPPGFRAGDIAWPVPQRFNLGDIANFGYAGDLLLPVTIDVPADATPGSIARIAVEAKWLVCQEECIPGQASLALELSVREQARPDPNTAAAFATARAALPQKGPAASARLAGTTLEVTLHGNDLGDGHGIDAFAETRQLVANTPPRFALRDGNAVLTFTRSDYFLSLPAALDLVIIRPGAIALRTHAIFQAP